MEKNIKKQITPGTILVIIITVIIVVWLLYMDSQNNTNSPSMRELRQNAGKHYTEMEFTEFGACDRLVGGTVGQYGDDRGYYCYQTVNSDGKTIWKVGNIYD